MTYRTKQAVDEIKRRAGIKTTVSAIRFYDDNGVVNTKRHPHGYRIFSEANIEKLIEVLRNKDILTTKGKRLLATGWLKIERTQGRKKK